MRKILATIALLVFGMVILGEEENKTGKSFFAFSYKISKLNVKDVNSYFESRKYAPLSEDVASTTMYFHTVKSKFVFEAEAGGSFMGNETESEFYKSKVTGLFTFINFGYVVFETNKINLYPMIGMGFGRTNISVMKKSLASFDKITENPENAGAVFTRTATAINVGFGVDYTGLIGLAAIKGGYIFQLGDSSKWLVNDIEVSGGPSFSFGGPYIQFVFGM